MKTLIIEMKKRWQSLTFRILLYFFLAIVLLALILSVSFVKRIKPHFEHDLYSNLAQYIDYVTADIGSPPDLTQAQALASSLSLKIRIEGKGVDWSSHTRMPRFHDLELNYAPDPYQRFKYGRHRHNFQLMTEVGGYRYLYMMDNRFRRDSEKRYGLLFALIGGVLVLLFIAIQTLFKPIKTISGHFEKIGQGNFEKLDSSKFRGEFVELSEGINRMTGQVETMLESKSALLLAISHELRSPLARMRINLELLRSEDNKAPLINDIQEIDQLISVLLESERLNAKHAPINLSFEQLDTLVLFVIEQSFPDSNIKTDLADIKSRIDPMRFKLVAKNLIENAIRYSNKDSDSITVKLEHSDNQILFSVEDRGRGMSNEEVSQATDPFYRADSARSRNTGGYGLGLYLCRLVARAHSGELTIISKKSQRTKVVMSIPDSL